MWQRKVPKINWVMWCTCTYRTYFTGSSNPLSGGGQQTSHTYLCCKRQSRKIVNHIFLCLLVHRVTTFKPSVALCSNGTITWWKNRRWWTSMERSISLKKIQKPSKEQSILFFIIAQKTLLTILTWVKSRWIYQGMPASGFYSLVVKYIYRLSWVQTFRLFLNEYNHRMFK